MVVTLIMKMMTKMIVMRMMRRRMVLLTPRTRQILVRISWRVLMFTELIFFMFRMFT